ncbi:MAG: NusG domain II-containing protein [bacterium]|nr:NusG domain II-containing protein [bacterium]
MWQKSRFRAFLRYLTLGDRILIICLFLASIGSGIKIKSLHSKPSYCIISVNGKDVYKLSLFESRKVTVTGPLGESIIEIANGSVRMIASPCPLKVCVHQGFIHNSDDVIICIPNQVMIRMTGEKETDSVTW